MADTINNEKIYRKVSNTGTFATDYAVVNLDATNFCITLSGSVKSLSTAFVPADRTNDGKLKVYVKNGSGDQWTWDAYTTNQASSFVVRDGDGRIQASTPTATNDVVNLTYANSHYVPIVTSTGSMAAYVKWDNGTQGTMAMSWGSEGDTIALRDNQGRITIGAPTESGHAVNLGTLNSTLTGYVPSIGISGGIDFDQWGNITVKGTSWSVHANTTSSTAGIQLDLSGNEKRVVINNARLVTTYLTIDNNNTINSWYNNNWLTYTLPSTDGTLALNGQAQPASDVYSWAKASTKPAYAISEISGWSTIGTVAASTTSIVTTVSASSSNSQIPTALAVWNAVSAATGTVTGVSVNGTTYTPNASGVVPLPNLAEKGAFSYSGGVLTIDPTKL